MERAGASNAELADSYYVALLHAAGCTSNSHEAGQLFGDGIGHRAAFFLVDSADRDAVLAFYREWVGAGRPPEVRAQMLDAALANPARARESFAAMCEVAQRFAGWLGLGAGIQAAIEFVFARWDGRGLPGAAGKAIPLPARLLHVARDMSLFLTAEGTHAARVVIERRAGEAYDPRLAALTGLKSPWLREHSTSVAELAEAAAWHLGAARRGRTGRSGAHDADEGSAALVRYWTGDLTSLGSAPCTCGRTFVRMARITGRADDMLIIRGVNVFPTQVAAALLRLPELTPNYRIIVARTGTLDEAEVEIEVSEAFLREAGAESLSEEHDHVRELRGRSERLLGESIGCSLRVTLTAPGTIPRSEGGKLQRVVDRRTL